MKKYITKENIIIVLLMLIATIISSLFIFNKVLYKGVDTEYHLSRIIGIVNSWKSGDLLAFIHLDKFGYGYAMGFFYSNIFMIIPCLLYLCGVNIFIVYKILIFMCGFLTAISMFACVKGITKNKYAATVAMFIYTTCSYRIITALAKGFIGELMSFIFIPIIILGLYKIIYEDEKKWWIFSLGCIGILNSNLVMTEIMIVLTVFILILNIRKIVTNKNRFLSLIKASIVALLVSAAFWMPMIEQLINSEFRMTALITDYNPTKWLIDYKNILWGTIQYESNLAAAYRIRINICYYNTF